MRLNLSRVLLLVSLTLALASCRQDATPLPLEPATLRVSEALTPGSRVAYIRVPSGQTGHLKTASLSAKLSVDGSGASTISASGDVYATASPPCEASVDGEMVCASPVGTLTGSFSVKKGDGYLNAQGPVVVEGVNGNTLWLGLRVREGQFPAGTTLNLRSSVIP